MKGELTIIFDEEEAEKVVTLLLGLDERLSFMEQQMETLLEKLAAFAFQTLPGTVARPALFQLLCLFPT